MRRRGAYGAASVRLIFGFTALLASHAEAGCFPDGADDHRTACTDLHLERTLDGGGITTDGLLIDGRQ